MPDPVNYAVRAYATVYRGTTVFCLGRVKAKDASHNRVMVVQGDMLEINYRVEKKDDGTEVDSGQLTIADVILDTPSNGDIWTVDRGKGGFNFIAKFEKTLFTEDVDYNINIEFVLDNTDSDAVKGQWGVNVRSNNSAPDPP